MMNSKVVRNATGLCLVLFMAFTGAALAQAPGGGDAGGRGGPGGRGGRFNREEMMARMDQMLRESLWASEDEWEVLGPMVREVMQKQREAGGGMGRMMGRRGGRGFRGRPGGPGGPGGPEGPGGPDGQQPGAEAQQQTAADILAKALENAETPAAEIKEKLEAYRKEKAEKEAELKELQENLRKVVTQRQEAKLVLMGALD